LGKEFEMKFKTQVEVLYELNVVIKGNEPFLSFHYPGRIVNLKDASGRSHNFIDAIFGQIGIPMDRLKVGDILKFQFCRAYPVKIPWWKFWERGEK
jgi:hypothetical protein